jgi:hypothetical protein
VNSIQVSRTYIAHIGQAIAPNTAGPVNPWIKQGGQVRVNHREGGQFSRTCVNLLRGYLGSGNSCSELVVSRRDGGRFHLVGLAPSQRLTTSLQGLNLHDAPVAAAAAGAPKVAAPKAPKAGAEAGAVAAPAAGALAPPKLKAGAGAMVAPPAAPAAPPNSPPARTSVIVSDCTFQHVPVPASLPLSLALADSLVVKTAHASVPHTIPSKRAHV